MEIIKIAVNGTLYDIKDTVTSVNGKSGAIEAQDIASVLIADGYKLTDDNNDTTYQFSQSGNTLQMGTNGGTKSDIYTPTIPTSLPASDVYDWAKASTKPTYKANEVMSISVVNVSKNVSSSCSITGSSNAGKAQTIIYKNSSTSTDRTVTVPTTYKTPDGAAIELTCPKNGYCEVSYLNIGGTIYARGL